MSSRMPSRYLSQQNIDRIAVFEDTRNLFTNGKYKSVNMENSELYSTSDFSITPIYEVPTDVHIWDMDTIDAALLLKQNNYNPLLLNMADQYERGGLYLQGAATQEENIIRRSNYIKHLEQIEYPYKDNEVIYSPNVFVFKTNEISQYEIMDKPTYIDIIAAPAINSPRKTEEGDSFYFSKDEKLTTLKIRTIFKCAYDNGHDSLVLSALGCGAFYNPVEAVARIFQNVIEEFDGCFKIVVFAILDRNKRNITIFRSKINHINRK